MKKRIFDVFLSSTMIVACAPVMGVLIAGTALTLGRPIYFKQKRIGKDGMPFDILKIRSMTDARDEEGNLLPDAQRMTRFGKLIRKVGIDELPQLYNILKGDMSFVGPRPSRDKIPSSFQ